jgi:hypothetical protein
MSQAGKGRERPSARRSLAGVNAWGKYGSSEQICNIQQHESTAETAILLACPMLQIYSDEP